MTCDSFRIRWQHCVGAVLLVCGAFVLGQLWKHYRTQDPIVIHWNTAHQTIDGFGASVTGYVGRFTSNQADLFFSRESGLGLSLVRLNAVPDTLSEDCGCVANSAHPECVTGIGSQILAGDLQVAQL